MATLAGNVGAHHGYVPQVRPEFVRRHSAAVRDEDRRRAALALAATLRIAGLSGKGAAHVLEVHQSTVSRHTDGQHDSPYSRMRECCRALTRKGAPPLPLIADLIADVWEETVRGKDTESLRAMKKDLHREESRADATVDVWQCDDMAGEKPESEAAVDEAILNQISRLVQLYAVRQEIRAKGTP